MGTAGAVDTGTGGWVHRIATAPAALPVAGTLLGLAAVVEAVGQQLGPDQRGRYLLLVGLLALATTVPVLLRPPALAVAAVSAAAVLSLVATETLTVAGVAAQVLAAYRLGRDGRPGPAVLPGALFLVLTLANPDDTYARVLAALLAFAVPAAAALGSGRRVHREDAENRAVRHAIAGTVLEHTASRERARIARELHDVVAHHISMIAVQAETARLTTPGMPPAGAQRLLAIGDTARGALTEMRRLLGVLREDARTDVADLRPELRLPTTVRPQPDLRPQPGLRQLNELLDEAREATGAGTRLILRGPPVGLDPGVELAAYRIVQEALTNSRRHAPGAAVDVELHYTPGALRLLIRDNGPGPAASQSAVSQSEASRPAVSRPAPSPSAVSRSAESEWAVSQSAASQSAASQSPASRSAASRLAVSGAAASGSATDGVAAGHGLLGMRERAAAVGGELRTGPGLAGGFVVEATLPTDAGDVR